MPDIRIIDTRGGTPRVIQTIKEFPDDPYRRQLMAGRSTTTPDQWRTLIRDPVFSVRYAVATSPHVPSDYLSLMVVDPHPFVRAGVANNPRTPESALKALAKDRDPNVALAARDHYTSRQADDLSL